MFFLRRYLHWLAYVFLCIPLFVMPSFVYQYIFSQVYALRFLAVCSLFPLCVFWIYDGVARPRWKLTASAFGAFIIGLFLVNAASSNPVISYLGVWERFGSAIDWLMLLIFFALARTVIRTGGEWRGYMRFYTGVATLVALIGILQRAPWLQDGDVITRSYSTTGSPLFLAAYLLLSLGVGLYCSYSDERFSPWYKAACLIQLVALLLTVTRAGLAGLIVAFVVYSFFSLVAVRRRFGRRYALIGTAALVIILVGSAFLVSQRINHREAFKTKSPEAVVAAMQSPLFNKSVTERLINTRIAFQGFFERPLTGWGTGNYPIVFQKYYSPKLYFGSHYTGFFDKPHNQWLSVLVENGIIGFALALILALAPILMLSGKAVKQKKVRILLAFYGGYIVYLLFSIQSVADALLLTVFLALSEHLSEGAEAEEAGATGISGSIAIGVCATSMALACAVLIRPVAANYFIRASDSSSSVGEKIALLDLAASLSRQAPRVITDRLTGELRQLPEDNELRQIYDFALKILYRVTDDSPYDMRYQVLLARLDRAVAAWDPGAVSRALARVDYAIRWSGGDPQLYQLRGLLLIDQAATLPPDDQRSTLEQAARNFSYAYSLAPSIIEAGILDRMGTGILNGNFDAMHEYMKNERLFFRGADWELVYTVMKINRDTEGIRLLRGLIVDYFSTDAWFIPMLKDIDVVLSENTL